MYATTDTHTRPLVLPRGKVIGPTFRFSVPLVDFKVIPYGMYVRMYVCVSSRVLRTFISQL